ncbi:MAG: glycosyltransferase family 10 [Treponema sp.]|nr:glycosyltransferase family 10 [Treponema sp.]
MFIILKQMQTLKNIKWRLSRKISKLSKLAILAIKGVFVKLFFFTYEMIVSISDKSIRVCYTNFWPDMHKTRYASFFFDSVVNNSPNNQFKFRVVKYYNPHIQFFSVFGNIAKLKNSGAHVKVFFTGENVNNFKLKFRQYKGNCTNYANLSMGFDFSEENNYLRFPLWLIYFFLPGDSKDDIRTKLDYSKMRWNKTKFCSLIARHDMNGVRTRIFNDISKISTVDCPGNLFHNDDALYNKYNDNKLLYLQQYKFNICPENTISDGYVTEKIFECLYSGCIPIYNGWSKDPEPGIINPEIILWYDEHDEKNNKSILNEIKKMEQNDHLYRSFAGQPFFCDTAVDKIFYFLSQYNERIKVLLNTFFSGKS